MILTELWIFHCFSRCWISFPIPINFLKRYYVPELDLIDIIILWKKRHTVQIKIHLFLYPSNIFLYNINIFFLNYTCGIIIFVENASCHFWLVRIRPCNKQLKKKIIFWYPSVFWSSTSKYPKINGFIKWLMKTNLPINIQRNTEPKRNQDIENCATCNEVYLQSFNPVDNSISHNSFHT